MVVNTHLDTYEILEIIHLPSFVLYIMVICINVNINSKSHIYLSLSPDCVFASDDCVHELLLARRVQGRIQEFHLGGVKKHERRTELTFGRGPGPA